LKVDSNKKEKMEEIPLDEKKEIDVDSKSQVHCKKRLAVLWSPAGMPLTKL
jgi:hypothetical protein